MWPVIEAESISGAWGLRDQLQVVRQMGKQRPEKRETYPQTPVPPQLSQVSRLLCLVNLRSLGQALGTRLPYSSFHPLGVGV